MPSSSSSTFAGFRSRCTTPWRCAYGERAADLGKQARGSLQLPGAAVERLSQRAAAQPAHHQVGAVGIAPVVVERDDVRVLELRDELCLGLEAADEGGLVDELGADDLDRHLAADRGW